VWTSEVSMTLSPLSSRFSNVFKYADFLRYILYNVIQHCSFLAGSEDRGSMFLRNVGIYWRVYMAPKPIRTTSTSLPQWNLNQVTELYGHGVTAGDTQFRHFQFLTLIQTWRPCELLTREQH
jgi:hypothetical protein